MSPKILHIILHLLLLDWQILSPERWQSEDSRFEKMSPKKRKMKIGVTKIGRLSSKIKEKEKEMENLLLLLCIK